MECTVCGEETLSKETVCAPCTTKHEAWIKEQYTVGIDRIALSLQGEAKEYFINLPREEQEAIVRRFINAGLVEFTPA